MDKRSIESLLRWLVDQIEESERRYSEALDQLQARLDQLSQTTGAAQVEQVESSLEEAETLSRLHSEVSRLAEKLGQKEPSEPHFDEFAEIGKVLSGQQASPLGAPESLGIGIPSLSEPQGVLDAAGLAAPDVKSDDTNLDKRLVAMAHNLEQSIDTAMPTPAIDTLNAKMDELAARFESALSETSKREHLNRLEHQIMDMAQELGRAKREVARLGGIEAQLLKLIEHCEATPSEIEQVARKAANEAAHLVSEASKTGAAERFDIIHRDLAAMNEQSQTTGDRLNDTLAAVHDSLKQLVTQVERGPQTASPTPRRLAPTLLAEPDRGKRTSCTNGDEGGRQQQASLRDTLGIPDSENGAVVASGRGWRSRLTEDVAGAETDTVPSTPELVAAARRAAQAATGQAKDRDGRAWPGETRAAMRTSVAAQTESFGRRTRPALIVVAALLLVISAMLLYTRLKLKPETEPAPQATEQSTSKQSTTADEPGGTAPAQTLPDAAAPPRTGPRGIEQPHKNGEFDTLLPPVRVGEAAGEPDVFQTSPDASRTLTIVPKALRAPETSAPQAAGLGLTEEPALPAGVILSIQEPAGA